MKRPSARGRDAPPKPAPEQPRRRFTFTDVRRYLQERTGARVAYEELETAFREMEVPHHAGYLLTEQEVEKVLEAFWASRGDRLHAIRGARNDLPQRKRAR